MANRRIRIQKKGKNLKEENSLPSQKVPVAISEVPPRAEAPTPVPNPQPLDVLYFLPNNQSISKKHLDQIENQVPKQKQANPLYLVLHSTGGDPFTAVKIMRRLTQTYSTVRAIIPDKAYSAATLMSLGAQELYMSVNACIGPLDLPMEHPAEGSRISALDVINAAATISTFIEEIALRRFLDLRDTEKFGIKNRAEAANIAYKHATDLVAPVMAKMDPYQTQKSYRELKIAWWYAYDLLCSGLMRGNTSNAWRTSKQLATLFPAHEYDIFREDAKYLLHLPVSNLESLSEWTKIEFEYKNVLASENHITFKKV